MQKSIITKYTSLLFFLLLSSFAYAAPKGSVDVDLTDVISTVSNGELITCAFINSSWLPAKFIGNTSSKVITFLQLQKNFKSKARKFKNKGNTVKALKLKKKSKKAKTIHKNHLSTCDLNGGGNPTESNFDSTGNVTNTGKIAFGIPSSLSASITAGKSVHDQKCAGCHIPSRSLSSALWSFGSVRAATQGAPMFLDFGNLTNAELANIMAYLFRFNS